MAKFCPKFLDLYASIYGSQKTAVSPHYSPFLSPRIVKTGNTGDPRNSRSFYLRFRLHAKVNQISTYADFPSLIHDFQFNLVVKINYMIILSHTVLPHYLLFYYPRYFGSTYLPHITRAACTLFYSSNSYYTYRCGLDMNIIL